MKRMISAGYELEADKDLNPELRKQVSDLRGMIPLGPNSSRFKTTMSKEDPEGIIIDTKTGRETSPIPLYAFSEVMTALHELFD